MTEAALLGEAPVLRSAPSAALRGRAAIPGDKSISHRALILGALADGETRIAGLLEADDLMATVRALRAFGADVEREGPEKWRVVGGRWREPGEPIDCGNSATTARLLIGAVAGMPIRARFTGDESLGRRPMERLTVPLARMGARFDRMDRLPIAVEGGPLCGIDHVNLPASAQVKSALLLAGLATEGAVRIVEPMPTRDHLEVMLRRFGCDVTVADGPSGRTVSLGQRRSPKGTAVTVGRDPSSAAFAWAAAAIVPGSQVATPGVLANPLRTGFLEALAAMGAEVAMGNRRNLGEEVCDVTLGHGRLRPVVLSAAATPALIDEIPLLAVVAAFAAGVSRLDGLGELRFKESDRLGAIADGLGACGVEAAVEGDALLVSGGRVPGGATVDSRGDHRIAMAFLVLGLGAEAPVEVRGAEAIGASFPGFAGVMRSLGAPIDEPQ